MKLFCLRLQPRSPWMTPWQSDTLSGLLCWTFARTKGAENLVKEIIEPALQKKPRFILSDAFPGDLLPAPTLTRIQAWPPEHRKTMKRTRWLSRTVFSDYRKAERLLMIEETRADMPFVARTRLRTMLDRTCDTTGAEGSLFATQDTSMACKDEKERFLSIYARIESGFEKELYGLFLELAKTGFGADISSGFGEFEVASEWEEASDIDEPIAQPNGLICLSTFQPDTSDSADGLWESFIKYGKLGPDLGLDNVFKRPQLMLKPGSCFRDANPPAYIGRTIPVEELLSSETCKELRKRRINIVQYAYGLAIAARLPWSK